MVWNRYGVSKFDGTNSDQHTALVMVSLVISVPSVAIDAHGNKWFGTGNGVSKYDGTTWTTYTTNDGLIKNWIGVIAIDAQDNKWFGAGKFGGVSKFDGTTWTNYTPKMDLYLAEFLQL